MRDPLTLSIAAPGTDSQRPGEMSFGACREGAASSWRMWIQSIDFLRRITSVKPRVADDAVKPLDTSLLKGFDKKFNGCPAHIVNPLDVSILVRYKVATVQQRLSSRN
jgi:hypothetical protein